MRLRTILQIVTIMAAAAPVSLGQVRVADDNPRAARARLKPDDASARNLAPPRGHLEVPGDPYIPVPREGQPTSPGGRYARNGYVSVQANVDANGDNIVGDAANEPSIAVDPTNPSRMVIGWRQFDTIASDFRQAGWGYTHNNGQSWTFPGVIEPGVFRSDPVLDADSQGNFYYNSLTTDWDDFWCHVYKSTDGGMSWDDGVYAYGGDKQWMTIDRTEGIGQGNIYAYWTQYYSTCYPGHFTRSYDGGQTFLPCNQVPGTPNWGTMAVGPDGELYIVGDGFVVAKSSTIQNEALPVEWDFSTTVSLDGSIQYSGGPNPGGLLGQAWIAVDHSDAPTRGNVYLLCSVSRYSTPDPLDVMFARSTDGGQTWSASVRVNDDLTDSAYQWFGTMAVAPNGRIDAIWADSRNDLGGYDSELYYAYSEDAGLTWSPNEALSPSFDPHVGWPQQNKLGDYYDMVSDDAGANVAYAATFNGEQDVYYLRIGETCTDAGTIDLDKAKYGCEDTAEIHVNDCGLNLDDETIDTVDVTIESDSEPAGEAVTLNETGTASGQFTGTMDLSGVDDSGVLLVSEGDTITATYIDADDGLGGTDVVVTATAVVDCTPPQILNVQTINVASHSATVTFNTNEPAYGAVRYGLSCGSLTETASGTGLNISHAINLSILDDETTYFYAVDAEDEAGNAGTDDNAGGCYVFTTPEGPSILLVDDDDNNPDVQSYYTNTLNSLGIDYDLWNTNNSDNEPDAATLSQYTTVIWFTGDEYGGACGPGSAGETALSSFLDAGGCFFINAEDYYYDRGLTSFMSNYLGAASITSDVSHTTVTGSGSVFTGFGPYSLSYPVSNYSDAIQPTATAEVAFVGNAGNAAVNKDSGVYRTTFWGFPFEAVPTAADREALLSAVLDWCAPGGPWPPEAENGNAFTVEDIPVSIALVASDDGLPEPSALAYIIASLPGNGSLSDPNGGAIDSVPYELLNNGNVVVYTPAADFSGSDNFPFKANDGGTAPGGGDSNIATILIDVAPDCNENEIADNQDMANCEGEAWCDDCNTNGTLDECDITGGTSVDCDGNGIPDECVPPDCDDEDACTEDWCEPGTGCVHGPIDCDDEDECTYDWCDPATGCVYDYHARQYGDVYPLPHGDGAVEGFDILCVLDQANDVSRPDCMSGDIYPCDGGDEAVEGYDILAVLDAADFAVENWCDDPCP